MSATVVNGVVIVGYFALMLGIGWWGKRKATGSADFLLAGRSLGPVLYCSTMGALVVGGGSTVGGVGLGYQHGLSGFWFVTAIGGGVAAVSLLLAGRIRNLRVYTIAEMLKLRYGIEAAGWSGLVMIAHTFLVSVTSTVAYATVFSSLFGLGHGQSALLGGAVVVCYCVLGGMWSISLTDVVQFGMKTVAVFVLLLPAALVASRGLAGVQPAFRGHAFDPFALGWGQIVTYFVMYSVGTLVSQDVWQRCATARSSAVARWSGVVIGGYCVAYAVAVALIGMAGALLLPGLGPSQVYATLAVGLLPAALAALVLAGAMAAMMSTASGSLIAAATVARRDVAPLLLRRREAPGQDDSGAAEVRVDRRYVLAFGVANVVVACLITNVLTAIDIGYDLVVSALIVPVLGGFLWKRATGTGALAAMGAGAVGAVVELLRVGDSEAITPVYVGLFCSAAVFVVVSLATRPVPGRVRAEWEERLQGNDSDFATTAMVGGI